MAVWRKPGSGLAFCLLMAVAAPLARGQSASELIERALSRNRDYLASVQRVREADALLRQAGMRPAPTIGGEGGSSRLLGSPGSQDYSVVYTHPLETGGKRSRRIDVARLGMELARAEADEKKRQLGFEIRQRYADAANARRRLAVLAGIARINAETLRLVAARVAEGDAAPLDQRLLEIEIGRAEVDRILLQAKDDAALLALERTGAVAPGDPPLHFPDMTPAPVVPSRDQLLRLAADARPDLRAVTLAAEQARAGVALAQAEGAPDIAASARYGYRRSTFDQFAFDGAGGLTPVRDRENVLAFGFSVPLFTRRRNEANVEAAVAREREAAMRRDYLASAIATDVRAQLARYDAAVRALRQLDENVLRQARENLGVIRQAWQLGHLRFIDVLNEQRRLADLELARAGAETDVMLAEAELAHAAGGEIR